MLPNAMIQHGNIQPYSKSSFSTLLSILYFITLMNPINPPFSPPSRYQVLIVLQNSTNIINIIIIITFFVWNNQMVIVGGDILYLHFMDRDMNNFYPNGQSNQQYSRSHPSKQKQGDNQFVLQSFVKSFISLQTGRSRQT